MRFLQIIRKYLPKYKWYLAVYILLLVLSALFSVFSFAAIVPILKILFGISDKNLSHILLENCDSFSEIVDALKNNIFYYLQEQISVNGTHYVLIMCGAFIIITSLLNNVTSYFGYYFRIPIRTGISKDIREDLFKKITEINVGYFSKDNKGDFVSRMTSDAEEVEWGIASAIDMVLENPVSIIVYLVTLFGLSWQLTIFAVALLVVCCLAVLWVGKYMKGIALRGQHLRGRILSFFEETLSSLRVVKSYNMEEKQIDRFRIINNDTQKAFNRLNRHYSIAFPFADFLATAVIAIMLWYGGNLLLKGESLLDASEFIYYLIIFHSIIRPLRSMLKASYAIRKSMASIERIDKILNIESPIKQSVNIQHIKSIEKYPDDIPMIELKNVSFSYTDNNVLQDVSFKIYKGKSFSISGRIGSGKTTIAELMLRFIEAQSGEIIVCGVNIINIPFAELRAAICYVNQEQILFNDTIYNNIVLGNQDVSDAEIYDALQMSGIGDFVKTLPDGFDTIIGERGTLFSGGQRQSICLARALLKKSPILILDEATSALDSKTENFVMDNILSLYKDKTLIIVSHNNSIIEKCADGIKL